MTEKLNVFAVRTLSQKEYFAPGHRSCQGCAEVLVLRLMGKALGQNVVVASATGCMEIVSSPLPYTSWKVPWIHVAFENAAAVASGIEAGMKSLMRKGRIPQKKIVTIGVAGDGGTADIGMQALSGALERGHDMIYLCTDNEAYMNTGIQRSSSTPFGASTTTSPAGRVKPGQMTWKKNMAAIAAAHNIPYVATACPSYPMDFIEKVKRAAETPGPAYLHVLSVCPTGWRSAPEMSIRLGRLAAETGAFPLYEVIDGQYRVTVDFPKLRPLKDYVRLQGRFRHLNDDQLAEIEKHLHREFAELKEKAARASIPAKAEKECIRCGRCVRICDDVVGAHALEMVKVDDKKKEPRPRNEAKDCIACGACVVACPVDVIGMEEKNGERTIKRWKRTVKLQECKSCGDLFAPQFQLEKFKEKAGVAEGFFDLCYDCRK